MIHNTVKQNSDQNSFKVIEKLTCDSLSEDQSGFLRTQISLPLSSEQGLLSNQEEEKTGELQSGLWVHVTPPERRDLRGGPVQSFK